MATSPKRLLKEFPSTFWDNLPGRIRVLFVTTQQRTGGWLAEVLTTQSVCEFLVEEAHGAAHALRCLRDEAYDIILVSHDPEELDALEFIEACRAGGAEEPAIIFGDSSDQEMSDACLDAGADGYLCVHSATERHLMWTVARTVQRHLLIRENRHLNHLEWQRLQREHDEAQRLLLQQRSLITDLEAIRGEQSLEPLDSPSERTAGRGQAKLPLKIESRRELQLPQALVQHYRELLRTYVIMGSGNLADELGRLARWLSSANVSPQRTMGMHLHVLEELIHGLGARSTRHVMTRADLLILEIMINLAEEYRNRCVA